MDSKTVDLVFCLHGLGNSKYLMSPLCLYLASRGFEVFNLPYPSTKGKIDQFSNQILQRIQQELKPETDYRIHLLGFSLGSQILAQMLSRPEFNLSVQSLLMLGPPNQGADFAKWLKMFLPTSRIWGPVFDELCEARTFCDQIPVKIGIIAGGTGLKYGFNPFLKGDNDGIVKVSETYYGENVQKKLKLCPHALLPLDPRIWRTANSFFRTGLL